MSATNQKKAYAKTLYLKGDKSQEQIAIEVGTSANTISSWKKNGGWEAERIARTTGNSAHVHNVRQVLYNITEQTLQAQRLRKEALKKKNHKQLALLDAELLGLSDQGSKYNKILEAAMEAGRIPLETEITVMEKLFKALAEYDAKLYAKTLAFQTEHLEQICSAI